VLRLVSLFVISKSIYEFIYYIYFSYLLYWEYNKDTAPYCCYWGYATCRIFRMTTFCISGLKTNTRAFQPYGRYIHNVISINNRVFHNCVDIIHTGTRNKGHHRILNNCLISGILILIQIVDCLLHYMTNVMTSISWLSTFLFYVTIHVHHFRQLMVSQFIRYARACFPYEDFSKRDNLLTKKLMLQGYNESCLKSLFCKFDGRYNDLVCLYQLSLAHMLDDLLHTIT
jgi:hypothetical protein